MGRSAISRIFYLCLILAAQSSQAVVESVIGDVPLPQNPNALSDLPKSANPEILISRTQYLISYNKARRAPNWVMWQLQADQIGTVKRTNKFAQDSELETYLSKNGNSHAVLPSDYKNSCFDRGHQIPSEDRTDTVANNEMTFEMSNMIPQTPYLNRVIWEHFEAYTRTFVQEQGKKVFVIDGPIYDQNFGSIGPNKDIPVPSKDFKVVFILDANQSPSDINQNTPNIAVIMPNVLKNGDAPVPNSPNCEGTRAAPSAEDSNDWRQYVTTISEVETEASLSFSGF